jgi:hypothetical protein
MMPRRFRSPNSGLYADLGKSQGISPLQCVKLSDGLFRNSGFWVPGGARSLGRAAQLRWTDGIFPDGRSTNPSSAHPAGVLGDGIHDRLEIGWRAGDHPQDLGRGGLLLQGLLRLVEQKRTFSMASTTCSANVSRSSTWRSVNGRTSVRRMETAPMASVPRNRGTLSTVRKP